MEQEFCQEIFKGERALFMANHLVILNSVFEDGESPLKESHHIKLDGCTFCYKYPLWYCSDIDVKNSKWEEMGRAGVWYTNQIKVCDSILEAPKNFRRCDDLMLKKVTFHKAEETLWHCKNVVMENVRAKGDYFGMNCENVKVYDFDLDGNYPFDGAKNIEIHNSKLLSKDAFWNCENVIVYDSYISGEYLGWNSKNLTFINCEIESLQGLCYIENLVMKNCKIKNTNLAFEYSTVDLELTGYVESIKNPISGVIKAEHVGELILEADKVDVNQTKIDCGQIDKE